MAVRRELMVRFFVSIVFVFLCSEAVAQNDGKLSLNVNYSLFSQKAVVEAKNGDIFHRSVKLRIFNNVIDSEVVAEKVFTLNPGATAKFEIFPLVNKKFSGNPVWRYFYKIGPVSIEPKNNEFILPFELDTKVLVCQSFDGPLTTHSERTYAIDFCAKEKTPVVAAKDGTVFEVIDWNTEGGHKAELLDKFNVVRLQHEDGTQTSYLHIFPKSANVAVGDKVKKGQMIALVGNVGYSTAPHLHFEYHYIDSNLNNVVSNPTFVTESREPFKILYGATVSRQGVEKQVKRNENVEPEKITSANEAQPQKNDKNQIKTLSERAQNCAAIKGDSLAKANECYITSNYEKAIEILQSITQKNVSNGRAFAMLGLAYSNTEQHEQAINAFKKALSLGWVTYDVYAFYARSLADIGKIDEAIKFNKEALKIVPNLLDVRKSLAEQLLSKGKKSEALNVLESFDIEQRKAGKKEYFTNEINQIKSSANEQN